MSWKQQWIDEVLEEIPLGDYRRRVEAELHDHLECQCRDLREAGRTLDEARVEALRVMGEPRALQEEYKAAWQRSLPGRLEALQCQLKTWAKGCAVMGGVHFLVSYVLGMMWHMAISLPADSRDEQVRLIRSTVGNLNNSYLRLWLPLVLAVVAGAVYLGRKFRASSRPEPLISIGLSFHWTFITTMRVWLEALDDHRTFWEEAKVYLTYNVGYYSLTLAFCILLGVVFGYMSVRIRRSAAA